MLPYGFLDAETSENRYFEVIEIFRKSLPIGFKVHDDSSENAVKAVE